MSRLGLALVIAIVLALITGVGAALRLEREAQQLERMLREEAAAFAAVHDLSISSQRAATSGRSYVLTGDPAFRDQRRQALATAVERARWLEAQPRMAAHLPLLRRIERLQQQAQGEMDGAFARVSGGDQDAAVRYVLEHFEPLRSQWVVALDALLAAKRDDLERQSHAHARSTTRTLYFAGGLGGTAALLALLFTLLLRRAERRTLDSEARLLHVFEGAAVGILEEDHSQLVIALERLRASGVTDLRALLQREPEQVLRLLSLVKVVHMNRGMFALAGVPAGVPLASTRPLFTPETLPVFVELLLALWDGKSHYQAEVTIQTLAGKELDVMFTASFPPEPKRQSVVVTVLDISGRKAAERARERGEERLKHAVRITGLGIFEHDHDSGELYWSPQTKQIYGFEGDAPPSLPHLLERVLPEDRAGVLAGIERARDPASSGFGQGEYRLRRPDGELRWLNTHMQVFFRGEGEARRPSLTIGAVIDVTEQHRQREALEQSEARLRSVFEHCPIGISVSARDGSLLYINPAAQELTGRQGDELVGKRGVELVHPDDRARVAAWRRNLLESGMRSSEISFRILTASHEPRTLRAQSNVVREKNGTIRGLVSTVEDLTERLRLEQQLRQAQKMEAVGQLAGGVAHDFNNLLTVILNATALLKTSDVRDQPELLEHIGQAADRAASLTAQLLAFSRKQVMRPRLVDLNELVENHCKMLSRMIGEPIRLTAEYDPGGAPAEVDPNLIEQVLMNLVVNARDAMPRGGVVTIRVESVIAERTDASDAQHASGSFVRLSVSDSGTGIEEQHLPHLFEPFFTTKEPGKGTGLGLATVYGIVEQHGGWVEVASELAQGTTVRVYLPRAAEPAGSYPLAPSEAVPRGEETILLVEDEPVVREMVRVSLECCGYRVHEAADGDAALALWNQHQEEIALLLTDLVMPGSLSGKELSQRLRAERPDLKVVYMSGYSSQQVADESWSSFVQKPFELATLARALRERLDVPTAELASSGVRRESCPPAQVTSRIEGLKRGATGTSDQGPGRRTGSSS